jgi:hypothetical protein
MSCRVLKCNFGFIFAICLKNSCPFSKLKNRNTLIFLGFRFFFKDLFGGLELLDIGVIDTISGAF